MKILHTVQYYYMAKRRKLSFNEQLKRDWKAKLRDDTLLAKDFIDAHQSGYYGNWTLFGIIEDVLGDEIDFKTVNSDEIVERLDAKFS